MNVNSTKPEGGSPDSQHVSRITSLANFTMNKTTESSKEMASPSLNNGNERKTARIKFLKEVEEDEIIDDAVVDDEKFSEADD